MSGPRKPDNKDPAPSRIQIGTGRAKAAANSPESQSVPVIKVGTNRKAGEEDRVKSAAEAAASQPKKYDSELDGVDFSKPSRFFGREAKRLQKEDVDLASTKPKPRGGS